MLQKVGCLSKAIRFDPDVRSWVRCNIDQADRREFKRGGCEYRIPYPVKIVLGTHAQITKHNSFNEKLVMLAKCRERVRLRLTVKR